MGSHVRIGIASDHNGVILKKKVSSFLDTQGINYIDLGPKDTSQEVDYVDYARKVAELLSKGEIDRGILICGTGIGMSIGANRYPEVRASLVHNSLSAQKTREHNDANILCLGSWVVTEDENLDFVKIWLQEPFAGGRHVPRVRKLAEIFESWQQSWQRNKKLQFHDEREQLLEAHRELKNNHLVFCSSGNISLRIPDTDCILIKPSGIFYEQLSLEKMVMVDLQGNRLEGDLNPSVDLPTHLTIYRHRKDVNAVVHTHSIYATAFASIGKAIPPVLTAILDEFGGSIPCAGYAPVGGDSIGRAVLDEIGSSSSVLLQNHGVFSVGESLSKALRAAIMTEVCAKTVLLGGLMGEYKEIPFEEIARAHAFHKSNYGQK